MSECLLLSDVSFSSSLSSSKFVVPCLLCVLQFGLFVQVQCSRVSSSASSLFVSFD